MSTELIIDRYAKEIAGVLNSYDRVIIGGYLQPFGYAKGMTRYLYQNQIRIFDYPKGFAEPLRDEIRDNAKAIAAAQGLQIEFMSKSKERKEDRVQAILQERGKQPGLVCILSAMEQCRAYKPWHSPESGHTYLKDTQGKCLHYYFYFIDEELGLCYMRVPTWCPFQIQFYFNGHNALAAQLDKAEIEYELADNAFLHIGDFEQANDLAKLNIERLHEQLDIYARQYCPVIDRFGLEIRWSITQAEFATDVVFRTQNSLEAMLPPLMETLIQAVKPADIATFLGRKLDSRYQDEVGNRFNHRWLGRRIKHTMGPVSIKMYDKFNAVLRIETTVNNVSFFQHYRTVAHRDGTTSKKYAKMKKSIYSLAPLAETLETVNHRYLTFISAIDTPEAGVEKLHRLTETVEFKDHRYKDFNLLSEEDSSLLRHLLNGQFLIQGLSNKALRQLLPDKNSGQISRLLKRLRIHGLIRKVPKRHRYYLSVFGRQAAILALKLRELVLIPHLAFQI